MNLRDIKCFQSRVNHGSTTLISCMCLCGGCVSCPGLFLAQNWVERGRMTVAVVSVFFIKKKIKKKRERENVQFENSNQIQHKNEHSVSSYIMECSAECLCCCCMGCNVLKILNCITVLFLG